MTQANEADAAEVPRALRSWLSQEMLDTIAQAVHEAEARTSGEIVVHIVGRLLPLESPRRRARRVFHELGVDRTKRRNGLLLFLAMKRRRFEIVVDEGLDSVDAEVWKSIATGLSARIGRDGFAKGVSEAVGEIGDVLADAFPSEGDDDANELPNRPSLGSS